MANIDKSEVVARPSDSDNASRNIDNRHGMPGSLRRFTPDEYEAIGVKATLKQDIIIMPCLMVTYILNYLDRNNIASAKLANIEHDLNLSPTEYQSSVSILFAGYSRSPVCNILPLMA